MRYLLTSRQIKEAEKAAIDGMGIPSLVLMERAALAVCDEVKKLLDPGMRAVAVCGIGGNGADGLAAARMLTLEGYDASVCIIGDRERATSEWKTQCHICEKLGMNLNADVKDAHVIIDALFGIGLTRDVSGQYEDAAEAVNASQAKVVSVDIASGICADSGRIMGTAVRADVTVTFQYEKIGHYLYPGKEYTGELVLRDIGIPCINAAACNAFTFDASDLGILCRRPQNSNKGTFGKIVVIAGSYNMCGAAYFSALASVRCGAGLVYIFTPDENRIPLQTLLPEAVLLTYDRENICYDKLDELLKTADCAVLGPGLSTEEYAVSLVEHVLSTCEKPLVIDADALNIMSVHRDFFSMLRSSHVLTPHIKEFSRLSSLTVEAIKADPINTSRDFSNTMRAAVVLKDAVTVVCDERGRTYINSSGCSALATGGSGDVLSGIIAAGLAVSDDGFSSICRSVYLHGKAGEQAASEMGEAAVKASDIVDSIGGYLCRI